MGDVPAGQLEVPVFTCQPGTRCVMEYGPARQIDTAGTEPNCTPLRMMLRLPQLGAKPEYCIMITGHELKHCDTIRAIAGLRRVQIRARLRNDMRRNGKSSPDLKTR